MENIKRSVRMGIDVGGTYTKAVAIDNVSHEIIGSSSVKTTHKDKLGVSRGVVEAFNRCLEENNIKPEEVVFVAHSTTQATNALVEGDVCHVGVLGMGIGGLEGFLSRIETNIKNINLTNGREIKVEHEFLYEKNINYSNVKRAIESLRDKGAKVIVSSKAYGVDDIADEKYAYDIAQNDCGMLATMASDITKLYGLSRRTRTAIVNASILPTMLNAASLTEEAVKKSGVKAPLMIMRGDGGVMEINEMKKRPVLTMLSGPAASVMGSVLYLKASNGVYFEVGGTTTNIGIIKNGRPVIDYSMVGGYRTYIPSLDVRVVGCAGGSICRVGKDRVSDVGPRSAHIAGLEYSCFTPLSEIEEPTLELFSPVEGDLSDYVSIRLKNGKRVAITNTCAANVLGLVASHDFAYGNALSARKCMEPLAKYLHTTVEKVALDMLEKSYLKILPIIKDLELKYKIREEDINLVGVGGGAGSLIRYIAKRMNVKWSIPKNAEIISSIGVALAMVRDVVERTIPSPTPEDIRKIKGEAIKKAIESGACPSTVEVHIEIEPETAKLRGIAIGSTEAKDIELSECSDEERLEIAAKDLHLDISDVELICSTNSFYAYTKRGLNGEGPIRVLDKLGIIRVQRDYAYAKASKAIAFREIVEALWEDMAIYNSDAILRPDFYICYGGRVMDFNSSAGLSNILMLMNLELNTIDSDEDIVIAAARNKL